MGRNYGIWGKAADFNAKREELSGNTDAEDDFVCI